MMTGFAFCTAYSEYSLVRVHKILSWDLHKTGQNLQTTEGASMYSKALKYVEVLIIMADTRV